MGKATRYAEFLRVPACTRAEGFVEYQLENAATRKTEATPNCYMLLHAPRAEHMLLHVCGKGEQATPRYYMQLCYTANSELRPCIFCQDSSNNISPRLTPQQADLET
eukprot:TRINITY_DN67884_c0_g1_i1.p2 TRINITY_DN67884_c0_g1~~TRINITY_DN67884_c0_g1_i1.p2  ORF type:complete len:107 (-),score=17.06 TRINITY_DN67884_c0_g1_i1:5-325(-)